MKEVIEERVVESSGGLREKRFGMNVGAKAFRTVIKNLYSKVETSSCRELGSNAFDSHIKAGKPDVPFDVHLPTKIDPTFSVRDYGVGLSIEDVENVYTVMFASTKDQSNDEVGKFGLGAKIPFAYCDTFGLTCWKDGRKTVWSMIIAEDGEPVATLLVDEASDEPSGVEVSFPVDPKDWEAFENGAARAFAAFPVTPNISNTRVQQAIVQFKEAKRIVKCGEVYSKEAFRAVFPRSDDHLWVRQGCVVYPIRQESMSSEMSLLYSILQKQNKMMIVNVPIGDVEITPNREEVIYDSRTVENLAKALKEGGSVLTADELSIFARAKIKSRFNWVDLFEAKKEEMCASTISKNVGDPYPHVKIFGKPISDWKESARNWRDKYLTRLEKSGCVIKRIVITDCITRNKEATLEDIASSVKVSSYAVNGQGICPVRRHNTYDMRRAAERHRGKKRGAHRIYYGATPSTEPGKTLFVLTPIDDESSNRDLAANVEQRMILSNMRYDSFTVIKGGSIKDVAMLWHFSGRPHITPEVIDLSLGVQKIVVSRMKSIVISDAYNSASQPIDKIISGRAKVVAVLRDGDNPILFGNRISIATHHDRIHAMSRMMGIRKCLVGILPLSKVEMAKEALGDRIIMYDDFVVEFLKSLDANEVDAARVKNPISSEILSRTCDMTQERMEKLGISSKRLMLMRKMKSVSCFTGRRAAFLGDIPDGINPSIEKTLAFLKSDQVVRVKFLSDNWVLIADLLGEASRVKQSNNKILEASESFAKSNGAYSSYKKQVVRLRKGNCERLEFFKKLMAIKKVLHKKSPIIAAMIENSCRIYNNEAVAGTYDPQKMIYDEIGEIFEKARLWE